MRLAIFDFDGTIIRGNSWHEYFRAEFLRRPKRLPLLLGGLLLRKARLRSGEQLRALVLKGLKGFSRTEVDREGQRIHVSRLHNQVRQRAVEEIQKRRTAGYTVVMATGAWDFVVAPCAGQLGVDVVVATEVGFIGDRCAGEVAGVERLGQAKAEAVRRRFATEPVDWSGSCAYSDSVTDLPLLAMVGEPVFVTSRQETVAGLPNSIPVECWG